MHFCAYPKQSVDSVVRADMNHVYIQHHVHWRAEPALRLYQDHGKSVIHRLRDVNKRGGKHVLYLK